MLGHEMYRPVFQAHSEIMKRVLILTSHPFFPNLHPVNASGAQEESQSCRREHQPAQQELSKPGSDSLPPWALVEEIRKEQSQ